MKTLLSLDKIANLYAVKSYLLRHFGNVRSLVALASATFLAVIPATAQAQTARTDHFVLKITTTAGTNASDKSFTFYTQDTNYDIDWDNDGMFEALGVSGNQLHTFPTAGEHTIRFRNLNDVAISSLSRGRLIVQADAAKYTSIEQWGTSVWNADMSYAFRRASNLIMTAIDIAEMSSVTNMTSMFAYATSFNGDISGWNTAQVTQMKGMFFEATDFDQNIGGWNTEKVTNMHGMFGAMDVVTSFNQDISGWNTAKVTDMTGMFQNATSFDQNISGWNTAQVGFMQSMFQNATSFNQNIGGWNTVAVTDMQSMFQNATSFDQNIGGWNTASVRAMNSMFEGATSFDQNIGGWNTAQVGFMRNMFKGATSFDQNIGGWNVETMTRAGMTSMFSGVKLSLANYDSLLVSWNRQNLTSGVTFHGGNSLYVSTEARTARANMISATGHDWSITDGGLRTMNQAPTNILLSSIRIAENESADAVVGMLSNTDTGGTYAYTLVTGGGDDDNGSFNILETSLRLTASADYEMNATYSIRINVNDGTHDFSKSFTITVTDVNEAPTASDTTFVVGENSTNGTAVGTMVATDPDQPSPNNTLTYAITGGNTGDVFAINPRTGAITVAGALDYETTTSYSLMVTVTDGGSTPLSATATLTITVTDVNEYAPVFAGGTVATVSYAENATTAVTTVTATDADAEQTITLALSGDDGGLFSITPAGELTFNTAPDFEVPTDMGTDNMYEVTITATDNGTPAMTAMQALTITVTDLANEHAPVFTSGATATVAYAENGTTTVTTVFATDADAGQTVTFTLSGGADESKFSITPAGELTFNTAPDYDNPADTGRDNEYEVIVTATDGHPSPMTATQTLTITVTDVNEYAPVFAGGTVVAVSYAENTTTAVTTVTATDEDAGHTVTFTLSGGADESNFSITPAGILTFNTAPDYDNPADTGGDNMYEIIVTATDGHPSPMTATQTLTITVTDVNDAPVFTSGATATVAYAENGTTTVTTVIATDEDAGQTVTFTLSGGVDVALFSITPTGVLTFNTAPDFENPADTGEDNMYAVIVTATDEHPLPMTATQALTITVTDVDDVPTGLEAFTDISVYPNPTGAVLHISGVAGNARYTLSGIDGKVLQRGKLEVTGTVAHSVVLPSLEQGIYLLQLTTGRGSVTRKIVKE